MQIHLHYGPPAYIRYMLVHQTNASEHIMYSREYGHRHTDACAHTQRHTASPSVSPLPAHPTSRLLLPYHQSSLTDSVLLSDFHLKDAH